MSDIYQDDHRRLQEEFDPPRLAGRLAGGSAGENDTPEGRAFIAPADMFFLATVGPRGRANCSYKGGEPGFVRVVDDRTIAFPNYDGNGMYLSMGNLLATT